MHEHKLSYTPSLSGEKLITLELTNKYGSITRCKASPGRITGAFRNDIQDILVDALSSNLRSEILLDINIPQLIFDFDKLVELFKQEMIAYQVLYNSENENPVIFYTPTQITVPGYA